MGSVGGLGFDGWIPPRIKMDDCIGRGQIQPHTSRFQANQEKREFVRALERVDRFLPVSCLAVKIAVANSSLIKMRSNELKHRDKLGKQKDSVPSIDGLFQQLIQELQLA